MKKVIVLGANGRLGSELCRQLGDRAIPINRDKVDLATPGGINLVLDHIRDRRPEVSINCMAMTDVDRCARDKQLAMRVNGLGVDYLVSFLPRFMTLMQISTDYVFKDTLNDENSPTDPINYYGLTKSVGEWLASTREKTYIVRTSLLYGVHSGTFVDKLANDIIAGRETKISCHAESLAPTYIPHLAKACIELLTSQDAQFGTYHLVPKDQVDPRDLVRMISKRAMVGYKEPDWFVPTAKLSERPSRPTLIPSEWPSLPTVEEGIKDYFKARLSLGSK